MSIDAKTADKIFRGIMSHSAEGWAGNHQAANRHYRAFMKAICRLIKDGDFEILCSLARSEMPAVRHIGWFMLLPVDGAAAEKGLKKLVKEKENGVGFSSKMVLEQWKKGELKFPRLVEGKIRYLSAAELFPERSEKDTGKR